MVIQKIRRMNACANAMWDRQCEDKGSVVRIEQSTAVQCCTSPRQHVGFKHVQSDAVGR